MRLHRLHATHTTSWVRDLRPRKTELQQRGLRPFSNMGSATIVHIMPEIVFVILRQSYKINHATIRDAQNAQGSNTAGVKYDYKSHNACQQAKGRHQTSVLRTSGAYRASGLIGVLSQKDRATDIGRVGASRFVKHLAPASQATQARWSA